MAKLTFRVTEVNDFSNDGVNNKRVVLLAKAVSQHDGTGLDRVDRAPYDDKATIEGRLELLVDNTTQSKHFTIGKVHELQLTLPVDPKTGEAKAAEDKKTADDKRRTEASSSTTSHPGPVSHT